MTVASLAWSRAPSRRGLALALPALLAGLLGWALLFRTEAAAAVRVWIDSTAYNHGFFVLPLAGWLAWDRRQAAAGLAPVPTAWPALAALPLGLAWFAADRLGIMEGRQLAALGMLETLLVCWLGWRLARVFTAPLAYLVFLVPFGAFLTPTLQSFTASFINVGLDVLAIPHVVTDYLIEIPEGRFFVAEACAGLRFLIAAIAFGALYALLMYRSPGRRLLFLAASCVVPVIANGLRALGIVLLGHVLGSAQAGAADHLIYGWGFFSVVILLLAAAGLPFREDGTRRPVRAPPPAEAAPPQAGALTAWRTVAAALAVAAVGPAAAILLDRASAAAPLPALPSFEATAACRAVDPAGAVRHFACGGATLAAAVRVLPARATPAAVRAALPSSGAHDAERVIHGVLTAAGQRWRLLEVVDPGSMTATALFLGGRPRADGFATRLDLAWRSVFGGAGRPVAVSVVLTAPDLARPEARDAALRVLDDFLAAQTKPLAAVAEASAAATP